MADKAATKGTVEERTRRLAEQPFEELDATAERGGDGRGAMGAAARRAAVTALAAAVAGALGGAAKAMLDRRDGNDSDGAGEASEQDDERGEPEEQTTPVAEAEVADDDAEQAEDADAPLSRDEHDDEGGDDARSDRDEGDDPSRREREGGAAPNDVAGVVEQAKQQLRDVLGNATESVSGLERSDGRWTVTLEVVDVRRIPESTDVLSSYQVVLDDDGGIVQMQRVRRYRRSQVDEDG